MKTEKTIRTTAQPQRSSWLDCIRFIAILMVFMHHVAARFPSDQLDWIARLGLKYGFLGVDIFFPLSGYLITQYLMKRNDWGDIVIFLARRFFRIVPLYSVAVTLYLIAQMTIGDSSNIQHIWSTYLFLTGWNIFFLGRGNVPFIITWSLSVEEFAYLTFAFLAWYRRSSLAQYLLSLVAFSIALRLALNLAGTDNIYFFPLARLDSLAIGALTAMATKNKQHQLLVTLSLICITLGTVVASYQSLIIFKTLLYTGIACGTSAFIASVESRPRKASSALVTWFGQIGFFSYYIYLFQYFNIDGLQTAIRKLELSHLDNFWTILVVAFVMTFVQAVLSYKYFEGALIAFGRKHEQTLVEALKKGKA